MAHRNHGTHTAAITKSGPNEGGGLSIPSKVKALPVPMAVVSCDGLFTTVMTEEGQLWNWGASSNYELGRGDKVGGWRPKPIPSVEDVRIIQIASDEGKVLSWGYGGHGQLGHSSTENQKVPVVIKALADERVVYIACGGSSSATITYKGKLYMWGNAKDSQLGVPGLPEVMLLQWSTNRKVFSTHIDTTNKGYGGFGALGHSVYHRELFPRLVEGSWNGKIRHIATSGTHMAANLQ
ncbi:hypothetical protein Pint_36521 [Pistacia integerrima]|uniref:Uncharacterized protein n=1 Tax=Pistacia integerrima TaxID=434235 RepID=A0ACC0Y5B1_9ROSI|nr:hypothetical protein Pint_36521 [Pistacia integerrima]